MIEIKRYTPQEKQDWNDFVAKSRQGTFLFDRNYMDYHQDRFHDQSLMIFYNGKLCALLPANEVVDKTLEFIEEAKQKAQTEEDAKKMLKAIAQTILEHI